MIFVARIRFLIFYVATELCIYIAQIKIQFFYLSGSQTLVFLTKIRNGIPSINRATWANADARLGPNEFVKPNTNQKIAIHESGGFGGLGDFLGYLGTLSGGAMGKNIQELRDLMRRELIGRKSGTLGGRISKQLI